MDKQRPEARTDAAWRPEDTARTLLYWLDVEALTPPDAEEDREADPDGRFQVRHVPGRDFPWRDAAFGDPDRRYRHFVRFGVFSKAHYRPTSSARSPPNPKRTTTPRPPRR